MVDNALLITKELTDVYFEESIDFQKQRYSNLLTLFKEKFGESPTFISRAPGRVNLIGEHIDYAGYAVLPMAIENDALIAVLVKYSENKENSLELDVRHESANLESRVFNIAKNIDNLEITMDKEHSWLNYLIAGYNCIIDLIKSKEKNTINLLEKIEKIQFLVTGNVPFGSGLSSSSALTVCSALAFVHAFELTSKISKQDLTDLTITYERKVGTACGGMDQTISIFGEKNKAKLIEFNPPNISNAELPKNACFIIANSLTPSTKINSLYFCYNKRVVENKLGIALIAKSLGLNIFQFPILFDLQKELQLNFTGLVEIIEKSLVQDKYTLEDIKKTFQESEIEKILSNVPYFKEVLSNNTEFLLKQRLIHVAQEAERVIKFAFLTNEEDDSLQILGDLMSESHESCKDLYHCSSNELDELVNLMKGKGAYGSRLTGAGWGGCTVSLLHKNKLSEFENLLKNFYGEKHKIQDEQVLKQTFFLTKPGKGACIINL